MPEFYEPILNLSDAENHNTMGVNVTLKEPVDGDILRDTVEKLRVRFPYFYIKAARKGNDLITVPNELPMTVRNTWEPINFNSEASNYHLAAWKYEGNKLAFELAHSLTDGAGLLPYIKSAMYLYLSKATGKTFDSTGFRLPGDVIPESESGNPFKDIDFDAIESPLYQKKPIDDFFRLVRGTYGDKKVFYLKFSESQIMQYCRDKDGSPNAIMAVLSARAARRYDPDSTKTVTVSICTDNKAILGNHDNYRMFAGAVTLDFPKDRCLDDIGKACTIARGQIMLQIQKENSLWDIKKLKDGEPLPDPNIALASICVSYPNSRSFGPLDPYIEELFYVTSLSKITDVFFIIACINHSLFISFLQPFSSDEYFRCFLEELHYAGIDYEEMGSEPIRMCGIDVTTF
ncbi:hypothetical protein [Butyrivibrio sp. VCD2006]|uniref:hypothetical protein n=1 Tax=Butyrivibrio sp. VCD2006 TaxID=1280664 RepID=UPI0003FAE6A6|nr:hypothetical protein [Butyrivibrio sp. VCD2006]